MKQKLNIGFVVTYSGRWPKELPEKRNREYGDWLEANLKEASVIRASVMGCSRETVEQVTKEFKEQEVDVIVMVYGAFTGDDVASYLTEMLKVPIILWAPYEVPLRRMTDFIPMPSVL